MSATVTATAVPGHFRRSRLGLSGWLRGDTYHLSDGWRLRVHLEVRGSSFSGYDYRAGCPFNGTVDPDGTACLYDGAADSYFWFSV